MPVVEPAPSRPPRLLIAAHGTDSRLGAATTTRLAEAVRDAAGCPVDLCFLDVVGPSLDEALDADDRPTVVVPLLLSTGYHVQTDIPAIAAGRPHVRVAAHLGPDPLVVSALADRLGPAPAAATVLVGVGSSRPEARPELERAGQLLGERLRRPVVAMTLFEDVRARLAALPGPVRVATYLLAEGQFFDRLCSAADELGPGVTADRSPPGAGPAGAHPLRASRHPPAMSTPVTVGALQEVR